MLLSFLCISAIFVSAFWSRKHLFCLLCSRS
jgi:hypothetical protein